MISIEFQQICLIVNRTDGADIVFPNTGHVLQMGPNKTVVEGTIRLAVYDGQNPVPASTPPGLATRAWIPTVGEVANNSLVRPKTRDEISTSKFCRAVFLLHGGNLKTGPARAPRNGHPNYGNSEWKHGNWKGKLTNWVAWEITPVAGLTYVLEKNGKEFLVLKDGASLVLTNRDDDHPDEQSGKTVFAEDFDLVYDFVNNASQRPVRPETDRVEPETLSTWQRLVWQVLVRMGLMRRNPRLPLCPVGQTEAP